MRKVKTFAKNNGWEYTVTEHEDVRIKKENIIVTFTKYSTTEYSMFTEHVKAIPCTNSPLMIERLYSNQGQCLENLDETIEEILERAKKFITEENVATEESENEFAEFEKSLNETEEHKEVISANNAHMNKIDRLQAAVSRAFGTDATILNSNERYVLVRYSKGYSAEFATLMHDWDSVYLGHYFTAWGVDVSDWTNEEFKKTRDRAIADYNERV